MLSSVLTPKSIWSYNPSPTGCVEYLPFWHPNLGGPVFRGIGPARNIYTVVGATRLSNGWDFDGSDDIITAPDHTALQDIFDGGGTIMAWINTDTDGESNNGFIYSKVQNYFHVKADDGSDAKLRFYQVTGGVDGDWESTNVEVALNAWVHVAVTYDNGNVANVPILYVNGVAVGLKTNTQTDAVRTTDVGDVIAIGNYHTTAFTFDGTIGELSLYNKILPAAEILSNYNVTKGRWS